MNDADHRQGPGPSRSSGQEYRDISVGGSARVHMGNNVNYNTYNIGGPVAFRSENLDAQQLSAEFASSEMTEGLYSKLALLSLVSIFWATMQK